MYVRHSHQQFEENQSKVSARFGGLWGRGKIAGKREVKRDVEMTTEEERQK